jgi:acyl-CoA synthetase (AMP-forming)/AMP-acid ligase II
VSGPGLARHWLRLRIAEHGGKSFLHMQAGDWTYAQLVAAMDAWQERLRAAGVAPGDGVAVLSDYSCEAIALFLALAENRNLVVPVATPVEDEVRDRLDLMHVEWVVRLRGDGTIERQPPGGERHSLLAQLAGTGNAGLVLFSSGSTGKPKAMVHDLTRLLDTYRERRARSLTLMVFLMFDHIGGLNTLFTALASGASMVIPDKRDPDEVCALIARHGVAVLPASPTFLNLVLMSGAAGRHDLGSLRIITYGTEPMPEGLLQRLRAAFPRVKFVQTFGTSETGISHTTSKSSDSTLLKLEDPNIEHRIVEGELWLRSGTQILGYLNHAMDSFTPDGWFKTGDLVEEAGDGYLKIVGRRKELINVGGEKVLPPEVESVLLEMPEISDCLVRGEANAITGQIVCAQVVLSASGDPATIRQRVRLHCRQRLAPYKIPAKVTVVDRTAFGERFKKMRIQAADR